jgi:NAD(P)-dependent dehydrogenase (short-subunit alcohol dehydrogenase family)
MVIIRMMFSTTRIKPHVGPAVKPQTDQRAGAGYAAVEVVGGMGTGGRVAGKVAIVTGATSGIGEAAARLLVQEGAKVVLVARGSTNGEALAAQLGRDSTFVQGDVVEPSTASRAVKAAQGVGGLDILVNNAGIDFTSDLLDTDLADVRRVFDVNFIGAFLMLTEAARAMRGRGGSIVNVSSRTASAGVRTMTVYGASKGALNSLSRGAAIELAPHGIRVNVVAPGLTKTAMMSTWLSAQEEPEAFKRGLLAAIPQGRLGRPEDVAAAILFLASDEAAHVTGALLAIDGGYTAA